MVMIPSHAVGVELVAGDIIHAASGSVVGKQFMVHVDPVTGEQKPFPSFDSSLPPAQALDKVNWREIAVSAIVP